MKKMYVWACFAFKCTIHSLYRITSSLTIDIFIILLLQMYCPFVQITGFPKPVGVRFAG
jgi:hypothetical protein